MSWPEAIFGCVVAICAVLGYMFGSLQDKDDS